MPVNENNSMMIPEEVIMSKIYMARGMKVMLDRDLAELYGVKAIRLREQVKRNIDRFPGNFMFRLTEVEADFLVSQNAIPDKRHLGGHLPYVFTEHGLLMLANVLKSEKAIKVSIRIIEIFINIREMMLSHKDILIKMERIEHLVIEHEDKIIFIFEYLKQPEQAKKQEEAQQNRKRIGFRTKE